MISYRIDVKQNPPLDSAKMTKQADKQIEAGLVEMGALMERLVVEGAPVGALGSRGGFRGSIFHEGRGTPVREMIISSSALYAEFVERGRRPGRMPPFEPIRLWVQKKLGIGGKAEVQSNITEFKNFTGQKTVTKAQRKIAKDLATQNLFNVTWMIVRKIGAKGTTGHFPFKMAFERGKPLLEKIAQKIGISIVAEWDMKERK